MNNDQAMEMKGGQAMEGVDDRSIAAQTFAPLEGYDPKDVSGKEGITPEDWKPAFLCIAQLTSKAKDETDDNFIEGIKLGDLYNSETKEIYGRGPVPVQPLRVRKWAYLPLPNGRVGEEISWNDPRCAWPTEEEKKAWNKPGKPKPEGVRVYDWVCLLLVGGMPALVVVSFRSKSFSAGQTLTKFVGMVQGPAFTAKFKIGSRLTENEAGKFGVLTVLPAGKPTAEEAAFAKTIYDSIKDKDIPTNEVEGEPAEPEGTNETQTPVPVGDDIPF